MGNMPTCLLDWMFRLDAFFNSVNGPAVICSPNTCSWRVTTSVDSWEPRSFFHHHCSTVNLPPARYFLVPLPLCYCYYCYVIITIALILLLLSHHPCC